MEAVRDVRDGKQDLTIGEMFQRVQPRLPALIVAGILAGLGIALGLVLLIVPGLFLLTIWSLIVPTIVLEGKSAGESFGRSRELVKGNGWSVFGVIVITIGAVIVAEHHRQHPHVLASRTTSTASSPKPDLEHRRRPLRRLRMDVDVLRARAGSQRGTRPRRTRLRLRPAPGDVPTNP